MNPRRSFLVNGEPVIGLRYWVFTGSTVRVMRCKSIVRTSSGATGFCLFVDNSTSPVEQCSQDFYPLNQAQLVSDKCEQESMYWESKASGIANFAKWNYGGHYRYESLNKIR